MQRGRTATTNLDPFLSPAFRRLAARQSGVPLTAATDSFDAIALFADMSGFSTLTTELSARGLQGAEVLSVMLNVRFGRLVDLVHQYGGFVLDFAGDAAVAYWPTEGDAADAARRAVACAHAINEVVTGSGHGGGSIQLRIGVGGGPVMCALVGGVDGRWHALMGGTAWTEMLTATASARPGEVVVGPSLTAALDRARTVALRRDTDHPGHPELPIDVVRAGIPRSIQKRLDAGQQGWLAEFRTVSSVFVNVPDLRYDSPDTLPSLQRIVSAMQSVVHLFGGSINDLQVDDKGTVLLAVWGTPLHAYEDNAVRATLAGMALRADLLALGVRPRIGITTGRAFAGPVGNNSRMRYGLLGEPIILAARLMQAGTGDVLCDMATRAAARTRVRFGTPVTARVPGRGDVGMAAAALEAVDSRVRPSREMVGREPEARQLGDAFAAVERDGESRLVVVRGEPGIGKSTLISSFLDRAVGSPMHILVGTAEAMAATVPYHAWRPVFDLLGVSLADHHAAVATHASAEAGRDLLVQQFQGAKGDQPIAIVLEDAHWMDSASWSFAAELQRTTTRLLLVIATRPMTDADMGDDARRLLAHADVLLELDLLPQGETIALACRRLDVDALPPDVAGLITARSEGHPLFTEQLLRALVDRGVIRVEDHQCLAQSDLSLPEFPNTVEGVIRSRIDLLTPEEQLTLKVASVFGRVVDVRALRAVHPLAGSESIGGELRNMMRLGLLEEDREESDGTVSFKHGLIHDVAYATLSFEQRRRLHRAAAEWYENTSAQSLDIHPLLARHWSEAGVVTKSLLHLERAGEQALRNGNYRETLAFLQQALDTAKNAPRGVVPSSREGVWLRQLGQACIALGRLTEARSHLERAVRVLGYPVPQAPVRQGLGVVRGALTPWVARIRRRRRLDPATEPEAMVIYEAATALDAVSQIYYLNDDTLHTAYCIARRFELLAGLVPTDLFARCSAEMAFLWEYSGIRQQADRLFEAGWSMANALQSPLTSARILFSWSVFGIGRGDWAGAANHSHASAMIYRQHNEHRLRRDSEFIEAYCGTFDGSFARALSMYERLHAESGQQEAVLHVAWAGLGSAKLRRRMGDFAAARAGLESGLEAARKSSERMCVLMLLGMRALMRADAGDVNGATEDLRAAAPMLARTPPAITATDACAAVAEAALMLHAHHPSPGIDQVSAAACAALWRAARTFAAAKPAALLWTGVRHAQHGRRRRAIRSWRAGAAEAERLALPFEEALLRLELGQLTSNADEALTELRRARDLCRRIGARRELVRAERALAAAPAP